MKNLGNVIWLLFGGFVIALQYLIAGLLLMVTIIGIPFGIQSIKLARFALWPFGSTYQDREGSKGCLTTLMNIIWLLTAGLTICITHLTFGLLLAITIIGYPFAKQHFKLAGLSLVPFGKEIKEEV